MDNENTPDEGLTPDQPAADAVQPVEAAGDAVADAAGDTATDSVEDAGDVAAEVGESSTEIPVEPPADVTVPIEPIDAGVVPESVAAGVAADDASEGSVDQAPEATAAAAGATGKSVKPLMVVGGVVLAAAVVVGGIWFVQRARGDADEALRAIPADMEFVVGIDLLGFEDTEGVDRAIAAFSDELTAELETDEPVETVDDLIGALEDAIAEESDIDLEEEVYPWIGRSAALGMRDLAATTDEGVPTIVAAISLRDEDGARQFVYEKLPGYIEESGEETATVIPDEDGDILRVGSDDDAPYISVREGLLLVTSSQALLDEATATAAGGESITGNEEFAAATADVVDQGLWFYFDLGAISEAAGDDPELEDLAQLDIDGHVAAGVGLTPSGIAMDVSAVITSAEADGDTPPAFLREIGPSPFRDALPAGTAAYFGLALDTDESLGDLFMEMGQDEYDTMLEGMTSGDPMVAALVERLFETLTGGFELAVTPAAGDPQFLIPVEASFAVALGIVDQASGQGLVDELVGLASGFGVSVEPGDEASLITVEGFPLGAVRVTDDYIIIGTGESAVTDATGDLLIDSELYQRLDAELPGEGLVLYVDMAAVGELFEDQSEDLEVFEAVAGSATQIGNRFTAHFVVSFNEPTSNAN